VAAPPGFEPGQKDSKSFVLPLHNGAIDKLTAIRFQVIIFLLSWLLYLVSWLLLFWCRRSDSNRHEGFPSTVFETVASAIPPLRQVVKINNQTIYIDCPDSFHSYGMPHELGESALRFGSMPNLAMTTTFFDYFNFAFGYCLDIFLGYWLLFFGAEGGI
jgi:hypothetical protein